MKNTYLEDVINFMTVTSNQTVQKVEQDAVSAESKEHNWIVSKLYFYGQQVNNKLNIFLKWNYGCGC